MRRRADDSRRGFLKLGAAALGVAATGAIAPGTVGAAAVTARWNETFDVIVVGFGIGGIVAAVSARQNGCRCVVIVEKMDFLWGSSAISGGNMAAVGSALCKKHRNKKKDSE